MKNRLLIAVASALLILSGLSSCRSSRTTASNVNVDNVVESEWTSVYAPVSVILDKPMSMSFNGRATMENGKYIHVSMRFMGFEVAVLYMDNDSVYFVDKYHKYLFAEPLSSILGEKYKYLTLSDIQQMILGRVDAPNNENAQILASDFVNTPVGQIASRLTVEAAIPQNNTLKGSMTWKPKDANWNDPNRTANFKTPENYTRLTIDNFRILPQ